MAIDSILEEWGDKLYPRYLKRGKVNNIRGGKVKSSRSSKPNVSAKAIRSKLSNTVRKAPEVMVKISGGGKNMTRIKAHMDYISRHGDLELEDENGDIHVGKDEVKEVRESWLKGGVGIPESGEQRREAFNIVLSMPPGTDREAVKVAARQFAATHFSDHQYIFAAHEDEKHPHVHLTVKAVSRSCVRLNPRKADLQQWRETFAEKLQEQGVRCNATPRRSRYVVRKGQKQAISRLIKRRAISKVVESQKKAVIREIKEGIPHSNPHKEKIALSREATLKAYSAVAKELAKSNNIEDKKLAIAIVKFSKNIPDTRSLHEQGVELVKAAIPKEKERTLPEDRER